MIDRVERLGATLLLYVVGAPQAQHLQMVFAVARGWRAGCSRRRGPSTWRSATCSGPTTRCCKSRSGETVKLVELLDEAVERAERRGGREEPRPAPDERAAVARAVGIGAVKYADLSTDRIKDYVFDWDRMLAFDGNTAPYLQYAHARICSIFRRAGVDRDRASGRHARPSTRRRSGRWRCACSASTPPCGETLERWAPHRLCTYLFDLASTFTAFYEACPVLAPSEPLRTQPAGAGRPHRPRARPRARPARHRRAGADVSPATTGCARAAARLGVSPA